MMASSSAITTRNAIDSVWPRLEEIPEIVPARGIDGRSDQPIIWSSNSS